EGEGVARIDPDRLVEVGDGAVEVALVAPHQAAIGEGGRIGLVGADRLVVVGERAVEVVLLPKGVAAIVVGDREIATALAAGGDDGGAAANAGVGILLARKAGGPIR